MAKLSIQFSTLSNAKYLNALAGGILGRNTEMVGQRSKTGTALRRDVRPASEDPYGDPADAPGGKKVRPASADPYGDPADQKP